MIFLPLGTATMLGNTKLTFCFVLMLIGKGLGLKYHNITLYIENTVVAKNGEMAIEVIWILSAFHIFWP